MKRFNALLVVFSCLLSGLALANSSIDLEATMKKMKFEISQAYKTESKDEFKSHITSFSQLLQQAKAYSFPPERKDVSMEGLNKVSAVVEKITLEMDDKPLPELKAHLRDIDDLRKEYHKKNKPSIWENLFS
ncbi:hypothetical protein K6Y31_08575 [Motilimonas cestriensis]|uniref:Soluble cytochrome b562 n=1 Tax=Motilimonas cestriensis TaxID=2742685 RepID=A0ABS8W9U1_9GAMM|nr:cytochrome b562 [Motilimonas cestriensis]MCE2594867.1 hypothetical protein [Motilimonas cestriensis]